ncbi:hypothetical protein E2C01_035439 [Portunus trituberculatus]|uniref:Uncharacterized protein n=1 Tax=Portunus trituberculatus TaxID=210409 RepID=A0A5B7F5P9_PORTR|nr:hypothetical protein [Portunus trituberculatus]
MVEIPGHSAADGNTSVVLRQPNAENLHLVWPRLPQPLNHRSALHHKFRQCFYATLSLDHASGKSHRDRSSLIR